MKKFKTHTTLLEIEEKERYRVKAAKMGTSMSYLTRTLIRRFLAGKIRLENENVADKETS